jgi:hypothetical protein
MARAYSGCEVLHQDFLAMALPESRFDGVFANASLFHVPTKSCRGYCLVSHLEESRNSNVVAPGVEIEEAAIAARHYRPPGLPRHQQPWLRHWTGFAPSPS